MIPMRRFAAVVAALAILPAALAAQIPDGWEVRPDRPGSDLSELIFTDMPPGWHVTSGPSSICAASFAPSTTSSDPGSSYGRLRNRNPRATLNAAALMPIPTPRQSTTAAVKPGLRPKLRNA